MWPKLRAGGAVWLLALRRLRKRPGFQEWPEKPQQQGFTGLEPSQTAVVLAVLAGPHQSSSHPLGQFLVQVVELGGLHHQLTLVLKLNLDTNSDVKSRFPFSKLSTYLPPKHPHVHQWI